MAGGGRMTPDQYALLHAVQDLDKDGVKRLLAQGGISLDDIEDDSGKGLLHVAVETDFGDLEIFGALLEAGIDPNRATRMGTTPLHLSAQQGDSAKLYPLVKAGADMNAQDIGGETPLHKCTGYNRRDYALKLVDLGADTGICDTSGDQAHEVTRYKLDAQVYETLRSNKVPPALPENGEASAAELLEKNGDKLCMLDAGATWLKADTWLPALEQKGERLEKPALLQVGKNGKSYLERAVDFRMGKEVLEHLARSGEALLATDLTVDGRPTPLMGAIVEKGLTQSLFIEEAWEGRSPQELQALYRVLPEQARESVGNYYTLRMQLTMAQERGQAQGQGR